MQISSSSNIDVLFEDRIVESIEEDKGSDL